MRRFFLLVLMFGMTSVATQAADAGDESTNTGFLWKESTPPKDCPFEQSQDLTGIYFTDRRVENVRADIGS